ncbi:cyclic nucleotide-binding domain-containing protein [Bosea sp. (in: a-proteobacteria)]|uniref:cyclic nucleotide-binding domain-containing protein n=1 Tax=Bosea sp. (in: a-proteobacteria) TaxID=1871050 RepID=UPI002FC71331
MTLESDIDRLKSIPLFRSLPASRLKLLALMGERRHFPAGSVISEDGQKPQEVYCVLEGEIELSHAHADSQQRSFRLATGSIIGDVPLLCNETTVGRISAKTDVSMLRLPRELFFELLDSIPEFSVGLSRDLASRLYRLAGTVLRDEKAQ